MKPFAYLVPKDAGAASQALAAGGAHQYAGGIDVLDRLKEGLIAPKTLVAYTPPAGIAVAGTNGDTRFRIGAGTTLAALAAHEHLKRKQPALAAAAEAAATPAVRNRATVGGNLAQYNRCWYYRHHDYRCRQKGGPICYAQDGENEFHAIFDNRQCAAVAPSNLGVALVALGATLELLPARKDTPQLPIEALLASGMAFLRGPTTLKPGELIQAVNLPAAPSASAYRELREKQSFDWPLVSLAVARFGAGAEATWRVVAGAVANTPRRLPAVEALLKGTTITQALCKDAAVAAVLGATPLALNGTKVHWLKVLVARTLAELSGIEAPRFTPAKPKGPPKPPAGEDF